MGVSLRTKGRSTLKKRMRNYFQIAREKLGLVFDRQERGMKHSLHWKKKQRTCRQGLFLLGTWLLYMDKPATKCFRILQHSLSILFRLIKVIPIHFQFRHFLQKTWLMIDWCTLYHYTSTILPRKQWDKFLDQFLDLPSCDIDRNYLHDQFHFQQLCVWSGDDETPYQPNRRKLCKKMAITINLYYTDHCSLKSSRVSAGDP